MVIDVKVVVEVAVAVAVVVKLELDPVLDSLLQLFVISWERLVMMLPTRSDESPPVSSRVALSVVMTTTTVSK